MGARILVIEDNAANRELVRYLLAHYGHQVLTARNGVEGLEQIRRERPDLVVCDLQMPLLDGYRVVEQLRADPATSDLVVVAVTAFSMPNDEQKVMCSGFNGYLSKPIEPESFVGQIEAYLPAALRASRL